MTSLLPPNASDIGQVILDRVSAVSSGPGLPETVTVEWRGQQLAIPVISMPIALLYYNPSTHRIRAQRSLDKALERQLDDDPYSASAQGYLHSLLRGDPTNPSKVDPSFEALRDDLKEHGQSEPGIVSRVGVLINGNTRRAALKEIGEQNIRVGVLPSDVGHEDLESIELSLQLRKDHRRDYSFMNLLLAIDERVAAGHQAVRIQSAFRIKPSTFERHRWILSFVREAIERSTVRDAAGAERSLGLIDFEAHQGKLEELYRAYTTLAAKSPDDAEALKESRLLALVMNRSKTDLRLIESDFGRKYMGSQLTAQPTAPAVLIPGTSIRAPGPSQDVLALRALTDKALQARARAAVSSDSTPSAAADAQSSLGNLEASLEKALTLAGKSARVVKRRIAAADRISDACDLVGLAVEAVAEARSTGNFAVDDIEEQVLSLRSQLLKLAAIALRDGPADSDAVRWLRGVSSARQSTSVPNA